MAVIDRREVLALVQQALVGNFLRNKAIAERLRNTGAGEITMSGIDDGHHPQFVRPVQNPFEANPYPPL